MHVFKQCIISIFNASFFVCENFLKIPHQPFRIKAHKKKKKVIKKYIVGDVRFILNR